MASTYWHLLLLPLHLIVIPEVVLAVQLHDKSGNIAVNFPFPLLAVGFVVVSFEVTCRRTNTFKPNEICTYVWKCIKVHLMDCLTACRSQTQRLRDRDLVCDYLFRRRIQSQRGGTEGSSDTFLAAA